jgi:hypothetical protein
MLVIWNTVYKVILEYFTRLYTTCIHFTFHLQRISCFILEMSSANTYNKTQELIYVIIVNR